MTLNFEQSFLRILDANINRLKEGLRVIEDILRFEKENKKVTVEIKKIRHQMDFYVKTLVPFYKHLINARNSKEDIGKSSKTKGEFKRKNLQEILISNFKRCQESLRVLEEISKIKNTKVAMKFKNLRFYIYELEKKVISNNIQG